MNNYSIKMKNGCKNSSRSEICRHQMLEMKRVSRACSHVTHRVIMGKENVGLGNLFPAIFVLAFASA